MDKALAAALVRAGIRPCIRMDTHMQFSVVAAGEPFAAAFMEADAGSDIRMAFEMLCEIGFLTKAPATVRVRAGEGAFLVVRPLVGDQMTPE